MTSTKPTLSIDVEYYQQYLDVSDLTDAQKQELLKTLWGIVCEFVMMGFNVHPVQQAQQSCAKDRTLSLPVTQAALPTLESEGESLVQDFVAACDLAQETNIHRGENSC